MPDVLPAEQLPYLRRRAEMKRRSAGALQIDANGRSATMRRGDGTGFTKVELDGRTMRHATSEIISQEFLDSLQAQRNLNKRAPLGDSHGAWQKCAEIPINLIYQNMPKEEWGDERAFERATLRIANDANYRAFRTDGDHRTL